MSCAVRRAAVFNIYVLAISEFWRDGLFGPSVRCWQKMTLLPALRRGSRRKSQGLSRIIAGMFLILSMESALLVLDGVRGSAWAQGVVVKVVVPLDISVPRRYQRGPFEALFVFGHPVKGFTLGDIKVSNGTASELKAKGARSYTAKITPKTDGILKVNVAADVAWGFTRHRRYSNAAATINVRVDMVVPVPQIVVPRYVNGLFLARVSINKPSYISKSCVVVKNGTMKKLTKTGSKSYKIAVLPSKQGYVLVRIDAGCTRSLHMGIEQRKTVSVFTRFDNVAPTVAIGGVPRFAKDPFNAVFTFSETVAGFEAKDITVSNAKVGKFSGKGKVYTALITPVKSGKVVIDVGAKVAKDAAGNGNVAAKQVTTLFDGISPSVAISGVPKNCARSV